MKKVFDIGEKYINLAKTSNEGWNVINIDDKSTVSCRTNKTVLDIKA